jgi:pimeloyl-ACP methyl ester carboxylesterase
MTDVLIPNKDLLIAVQEWPSAGPPLLLLHGMGGTLLNWATVIPHLATSHRVICMDLRNHGHSGSGVWSWSAVLDDVEAVLSHFDAKDAILVGHSLGGIIAALYGRTHPETPGIVNLDGFGLGKPEEYARLSRDAAAACLTQLSEMFAIECGKSLSSDDAYSMVRESAQEADQLGFPRSLYELAIRRRLQQCENGTFHGRPDREQLRDLWPRLDEINVFDDLKSLSCRALIVSATNPGPTIDHIDGLALLMAERREIVQRQLASSQDSQTSRCGTSMQRITSFLKFQQT